MSKALWFRLYSGEWLNDTLFLTGVECGVYINLLAIMHRAGGPIPDDPAQLSRLCKVSKTQFRVAFANLLAAGKIVRVEGGLSSDFVEKERNFFEEKSQTARRNVEKRWEKSQRNQRADHTGVLPANYGGNTSHSHSQSQKEEADASSTRARTPAPAQRKPFDDWWSRYPHKVGKRDAERAYASALKRGASPNDLADGIDRYIATKPPDRPWCNPATWLNQDRWADEPAPSPSQTSNGGRNGFGTRPSAADTTRGILDAIERQRTKPRPVQHDGPTIDGTAERRG